MNQVGRIEDSRASMKEPTCARESIVNVVMSRLQKDVSYLESLTERLHGKLNPVMLDDHPCESKETCSKEQEYPPLFNDIRAVCYRMENVIGSIENALSRTEL